MAAKKKPTQPTTNMMTLKIDPSDVVVYIVTALEARRDAYLAWSRGEFPTGIDYDVKDEEARNIAADIDRVIDILLEQVRAHSAARRE